MNRCDFDANGLQFLDIFRSKGISKVGFVMLPHGIPVIVTMYWKEFSGLRVRSMMHTYGERREIGVMNINAVHERHKSVMFLDNLETKFVLSRASKLVYCDNCVKSESGILLRSEDGRKIVIVPSAQPCALAVCGAVGHGTKFEPEFKMEFYREEVI